MTRRTPLLSTVAAVAALSTTPMAWAQSRFANLMAEPVPTTPEQFGAFTKSELGKYQAVVKAAGAKVDY